MRQVTNFDLLVSCPSDVKEELEIIRDTVDSFNRMYGAINNAHILVKHWSTDSYPQSGGSPQDLLNKQFILDCDAAVAAFWTRFGTPTDEYGSGTEEEIEELIKSGRQVFLYFSDCQLNPSLIDYEQYEKVLAFRNKYKDKGIYWTYSSLEDFRKSFLNHLSLYFVQMLANENMIIKSTKSKLSIKGVNNSKLVEQPDIFKRDYLNSDFIKRLKHSIGEKINQVVEMVLPKKVIIPEKPVNKEVTPVTTDYALKMEELTSTMRNWQDQFRNLGSLFPSTEVIISEEIKKVITDFTQENDISFNAEEFFFIGDLIKQQQALGGGPLGMDRSFKYVGTEEEKKKYKLIKEIYLEVDKYTQYVQFFSEISKKYYIELALSNSGTNYDEDVDVKIFVKKGLLCSGKHLPFPGDNILPMITNALEGMFKSKKSVSINEYNGYPIIPRNLIAPAFGLNGISYEEEVKSNKIEFRNKIESLFCYEYFQDGEFDILCYNQKYIKQNTNIFLPSFVVLNDFVNEIYYEISSKHYPEVIKEKLEIIERSQTSK